MNHAYYIVAIAVTYFVGQTHGHFRQFSNVSVIISFVFMINLDYSTHFFSMKTFKFQFMCNILIFQFLDGQKIHKMQHFPPKPSSIIPR